MDKYPFMVTVYFRQVVKPLTHSYETLADAYAHYLIYQRQTKVASVNLTVLIAKSGAHNGH